MRRSGILLLAITMAAMPCISAAQDDTDHPQDAIVSPDSQPGVYTTKGVLPWQKADPSSLPSPKLLRLDEGKDTKPVDPKEKPKWLTTVPFGKPSSDVSQPLPKGPQMMQAVPVQGVDTIEVTEPAAPSTAPLEADPAKENPELPTEATSPIFSDKNVSKVHKIILRVLNKVTGRSEKIEARPGEIVHFGKLDIKVMTCQTSDPISQLDHAGLFELNEHVLGQEQVKPLFRGWMYATSPSLTALEHPIYDVTMVECISDRAPGDDVKKETKADKPKAGETETPVIEENVLD